MLNLLSAIQGWAVALIIIAVILVVLIIAIAAWWIKTYNKLVTNAQKVSNQWSQIDVQLKKRYDLIPNLVETVKGYAKHEKETLENVVMWRSRATGAVTTSEAVEANNGLSQALGRLLVSVEKYPDLKANTNFMALQADLKDVEGKISYARQFFNDTVQKNNELIQKFPSSIVANRHKDKFKVEKYFEAATVEREAPKVQF